MSKHITLKNLEKFIREANKIYATKADASIRTVNNTLPDDNGNITINIPKVVNTYAFDSKDAISGRGVAYALGTKASLTGATFTGEIKAPKIVLDSGWELY